MIKVEWIKEWFEKQSKERGEYVDLGTQFEDRTWAVDVLDGAFPLDELAEYLNSKLKEEDSES